MEKTRHERHQKFMATRNADLIPFYSKDYEIFRQLLILGKSNRLWHRWQLLHFRYGMFRFLPLQFAPIKKRKGIMNGELWTTHLKWLNIHALQTGWTAALLDRLNVAFLRHIEVTWLLWLHKPFIQVKQLIPGTFLRTRSQLFVYKQLTARN